jgi:hypothetical protein
VLGYPVVVKRHGQQHGFGIVKFGGKGRGQRQGLPLSRGALLLGGEAGRRGQCPGVGRERVAAKVTAHHWHPRASGGPLRFDDTGELGAGGGAGKDAGIQPEQAHVRLLRIGRLLAPG